MASGIDIMMKALGIDPEEIKRNMLDVITKLQTGINNLDKRLTAIDAKQDAIDAKQDAILQRLDALEGKPVERPKLISSQ